MKGKRNMLSASEVAAFCQQIGMIVKAGLPIHYGISILRDEAGDEKTKALLAQIFTLMENGASLCDALKSTGVFPGYMTGMISLGEETGRLEDVLDSLTNYYERETDISIGIKHAVTYPLILLILMFVVISVIMSQVLPVFAQIYNALGSELSKTAQILMKISNIINHHLPLFGVLFVILVLVCVLLYRTALGKALFQGKGLSMSVATSRFANCMYLMISSGLDTDEGLKMAASLVDNPYMEEKIRKCQSHIKHGEDFGNALLLSGIFSKIHSSRIAIGQKTGSLEQVMYQISQAYEEDTDDKLRYFIAVLEPVLIVVLLLFIGLILITFLLPLLEVMSGIGL